MPTNDKEYMKNYMSKYNNTEKNMEYKRSYYEKNKEHIKKLQRQYYHKHKNDPNYSHYLEYRLDLQKKHIKRKNHIVQIIIQNVNQEIQILKLIMVNIQLFLINV